MKRALALTALWLTGCAVTHHAEATKAASSHTCDAMARCGRIGAGKQYPDYEACRVDFDAMWTKRWDRAACEGKVNQDGLSRCLASIDATDCDSVLDALNTALNKCAEARVCGAEAAPAR